MTNNDCRAVRREIDAAEKLEQLDSAAGDHLRDCAGCLSFASERRSLSNLIASLPQLEAPPDFDFKLRARLAREGVRSRTTGGLGRFLKLPVPVFAAVLAMLIGVGVIVVRNGLPRGPINNAVGGPVVNVNSPAREASSAPGKETAQATNATVDKNDEGIEIRDVTAGPTRPRVLRARSSRVEGTATRDYGLGTAAVVSAQPVEPAGPVVRVPLDAQVLRVSIDDGRGETRTVALPRVSFGSQRLVASQSFMPVSSTTNGVW